MNHQANINLPQWSIVVWIAAALNVASTIMELVENSWAGVVSLAGTIVGILLWAFIIVDLSKRNAIKPFLLVLLILTFSLQIIGDISSLFGVESSLSFLFGLSWLVALIYIIASYSGAFRMYAIVEIVCFICLMVLAVLSVVNDFSITNKGIMKGIIFPLLIAPYIFLERAITEGKE